MKALLSVIFGVFVLASCSQRLDSESGLYDVDLDHSFRLAVDGVWSNDAHPSRKKEGKLYVAPMDVSLVEKKQPQYAPMLVDQMHGYLVSCIQKNLEEDNAAFGTRWELTNSPREADARLDLAIVRLKAQKPTLSVASNVTSVFSVVPGVSSVPGVGTVLGEVGKGDICIEGTLRDCKSGKLLFAFKDSNRETVHFYQRKAYKRMGQADANLLRWAKTLAKVVRLYAQDRLDEGTLRHEVMHRSLIKTVGDRIP